MVSPAADVQKWAVDARIAREQLAHVREGEREATLRSISGGKRANTVRRWIAALAFLETLQHKQPSLSSRLMRAPFTLVELFSRWHAFDPAGAIVEMRLWEKEGGSFRKVGDRLAKARRANEAPSVRSEEIAYRKRMKDSVKRLVARRLRGPAVEPVLNFKDSELPPADYLFRSFKTMGRKPLDVVVLVVGPFSNSEMYQRRLPDIVAKAFAFAWLYDAVFLLVPEKDRAEDYENAVRSVSLRVRDLPSRKPLVEVINLPDHPGAARS